MKLQTLPTAIVLALFVGAAQTYFVLVCWTYIGAYSPLPHWLISLGLRGIMFRSVSLCFDLLINVILSLPAAVALTRLRPANIWLYLALAVIPSFIWLNHGLIGNPYFRQFLGTFILGWLPQLFVLPMAVWLVKSICKAGAPNNSSKRTRVPRAA